MAYTYFNKSNISSYKRPEKSLEAIYLTIWKKDQVDIHDHGLHATFIVVSFNLVAQSQNNVNIFKLNNKDHRGVGPSINDVGNWGGGVKTGSKLPTDNMLLSYY